ncbi:hypothetical protein [Streptomyces humi]|nr:hypothetical protein [Streptomyces humi]
MTHLAAVPVLRRRSGAQSPGTNRVRGAEASCRAAVGVPMVRDLPAG